MVVVVLGGGGGVVCVCVLGVSACNIDNSIELLTKDHPDERPLLPSQTAFFSNHSVHIFM